ncbi:uncharacterized protein LOC127873948 [Dreissena polymorpha]|nr:uncharacterized protein LOC127873948 [Dreissena polymorpha]
MCDNYTPCGKPILGTSSWKNQTFVNGSTLNLSQQKTCCEKCSCDASSCAMKGTCCPDILDKVDMADMNFLSCEAAQMRKKDWPGKNYYYMRTKCHPNYEKSNPSSEVITLCINRPENKLESNVPVLDTRTNVTYANKYCAQCNIATDHDGTFSNIVGDLVVWDSILQCQHSNEAIAIFEAYDQDSFIKAILQSTSCNVIYTPKPGIIGHETACRVPQIAKCNDTGDIVKYDPLIKKACDGFTSIFYREFKNVFCFLCNTNTIYYPTCPLFPSIIFWGTSQLFPEFSTLLAFNTETDEPTPNALQSPGCSSGQVYDKYEKTCRGIFCRFPKRLNGSSCANAVETIGGVSYVAYLKLTPKTALHNDRIDQLVMLLQNKIEEMLHHWELYGAVYSFTILYNLNENNTESTTNDIPTFPSDKPHFLSDLTTPPHIAPSSPSDVPQYPTDTPIFEPGDPTFTPGGRVKSETIDYFLVRIKIKLQTRMFRPKFSVTSLDKALEYDETSVILISNTENITFYLEFVDFFSSDASNRFNVIMFDPVSNKVLSQVVTTFDDLLSEVDVDNTIDTILTARFKCPLISLNLTEIHPIGNNSFRLKNGAVIDRKYVNYGRNQKTYNLQTFEICWNIYQNSYNDSNDRLTKYTADKKTVTATGILSLVCMIISVTCLLITLMTYCLFQELRTQPGINNMGLVTSLIVAQVLFQFGKGQHQYVPSWTCELIGALIHFFWLLVIFWMNVCCWHMFCVFNRLSVQSSKQSPVWKTFIYTIYTFIGSLLCVAINIIVVVVDTDNEKVGYGDGTCYISRPEMVGYTFALPVFIILVANIAMFCVVILKVKRTTSHVITSAKSNVNYVTIFAKLATLVGLSWIFGFIYTYTGKEVFEYLFIILSNGQGVFIFMAFICRKRVYHLYKEKLYNRTLKNKRTQLSSNSRTPTTSI